MTNENVEMETPTPPDNDTDAILGPGEPTSDHHAKIGPILAEVLEDLAKSERGKQDAESLRGWIKSATGQGLDMRHDGGQTLLHVAAVDGLSEAAKKLVGVFSDLNVPEERKRTPLFEACLNEHADIVKLLLDKGANTALADEDNDTPLYIAAQNGNRPIVEFLLNKSKETLNFRSGFYKWTPLHAAAQNGHEAIISYLRDQGSRLDPRDEDGWTPLWTAVTWQQTRAIEALIQKKKDTEDLQIDTGDTEARTPLMEAARRGFLEGVRLLIKAGAKCDKSESTDATREDTALHLAVSTDQREIVKLLLDSGAKVNARNAKGQHSSHLASLQGNKDILELLLDAKGSEGLDARDDHDMTPLHLASNADEPDDDESDDDEQETSDRTVNAPTDDGKSTSEDARYTQVVKCLLERNADTTAVTKDNRTALELAHESNHEKRADEILNSLEKISAKYSHALRRAASDRQRHALAISLLRKQRGTSLPNDSEDWSAIEWAAYQEDFDVLWLLIASSSRSKETKEAIKRAKKLVESPDSPAKVTNKPKDQKRDGPDDTKKRDNLILDILNNPLTGLICSDGQEYGIPSSAKKSFLDHYQAAVVQFREQQGRFGNIIKQSQSVEKTIYTEGPKKVMDAARKLRERTNQLAGWKAKQGILAPISMDANEPKFTWVHLPATNMTWMEDLLQRIMKDDKKIPKEFNEAKSFFKDSWIQVPDKVSPSRIMRPRCVWRNATENGAPSEDTNAKSSAVQKPTDNPNKVGAVAPSLAATAIYMPYFSYSFEYCDEDHSSSKPKTASKVSEPHKETETRQTEVEATPSKKPTTATEKDDKVDHVEDMFAKTLKSKRIQHQSLLDAYEEKIIHGSSTLDESYYHFGVDGESQKDKTRRNRSQVVTGRWKKEQKLGSYWPLIRVNQLWMWTIDDKWLLSASSHPIDGNENELLDGILDLLEKQEEAGGRGLQPSSASEMSQFIVDYCVESYERKPRAANEDRPKDCQLENFLSIRQTFSDSINSIARAETDLFEKFSRLTKKLRARSPLEAQSKDAQGRSLNEQLTEATFDAEELSGKVKDILDELNSLESTVHYQQDVQRSMKALKSMKKQALQMGMKEIKKSNVPETDLSATYIIKDINRLDSVAKRVHDAVNTTLSLQQSEVANLQAKLSIAQADASAQQSRVVMIFTVVTILFLPLSFLTSFFALDVSTFQAPAWAVGTIFAVSIAFFIPTVILAFTAKRSIKFLVDLPGFVTTKTLQFIRYILEKHAGSGASPQEADQSRIHPAGPQQTGNGKRDSSDRTGDDLEKGHGVSGRST